MYSMKTETELLLQNFDVNIETLEINYKYINGFVDFNKFKK